MSLIGDGAWGPQKVSIFKDFFYNFLDSVTISSKEKGKIKLGDHIYRSQKIVLDGIFTGLENDIHDNKIGKARQLGISSIIRPLKIAWLGAFSGMQGALVYDTDPHKDEARIEIENIINSLPKSAKFPKIKRANRSMIELANGSNMRLLSAGVRKTSSGGTLGRSSGINLVHGSEMCLAPESPVILSDGRIIKIKDIVVGDWTLTHAGYPGQVVNVIARKNEKPMVRIRPWMGEPILCTADHKIVTQRGKVEARDLRLTDKLVMPVRRITSEKTHDYLPQTPPRKQNGGAVSAGSGAKVEFTEDFGFAIGYYLAEGSITYQGRGEEYKTMPSGVIFTRHKDEKSYADRAIGALLAFTTGKRTVTNPRGTQTAQEHIYGSCLARWIKGNFGADQDKFIPDDVFRWGVPFCRGLIAGLLCGDGSKQTNPKEPNKVSLTTTRGSIATQSRDLVASIGIGWASIRCRPAGEYYGRNCKESWVVAWGGTPAISLRSLMGLPNIRPSNDRAQKYQISLGTVYINIKGIEAAEDCDVVYDITVDHPNHTFRTPSMSVSNCSWQNVEGVQALKASLAESYQERLYTWESTARGFNQWYEMVEEAKRDDLNQQFIFVGWWGKEDYAIPEGTRLFERYGTSELTADERKRIKLVKDKYGWEVTREQIAWWRRKVDPTREREADEKEDGLLTQDYPWDEDEMFQSTGSTFFNAEKLTEISKKASDFSFRPFKFWPGHTFLDCEIDKVKTYRETDVKIFEDPEPESIYVIAGDPAYGYDTTNDRASCQVLKCYADCVEQVAEACSPLWHPKQFAHLMLTLVGHYGLGGQNEIQFMLELQGGGEATLMEIQTVRKLVTNSYLSDKARESGLQNLFVNFRNYVQKSPNSMNDGNLYQWKTTVANKVPLLERLRDVTHDGTLLIRSYDTLGEMKSVAREGNVIKAEGSKKDDRVMSLALGVRAWEDRIRPKMIAGRRTRQAFQAAQTMSPKARHDLFTEFQLNSIIDRKTAERRMMEQMAARRQWREGWKSR